MTSITLRWIHRMRANQSAVHVEDEQNEAAAAVENERDDNCRARTHNLMLFMNSSLSSVDDK